MAKGVKKIKWTGEGTVKSNLSIPNKKVTIDPDQFVLFSVGQWDEGVTEIEKKKNLTWMLQDRKAKTIIKQKTLPFNNKYGVKISRNLCGPFEYYVEASISGKRDVSRECGLFISGYCEPRIKNCKWSTSNDGADVSKTHTFSYGNTIYLNVETEGLNGHKNLIVDVFRKLPGFSSLIYTYTSVDVVDGEINLAMSNTFIWYGKMKLMRETEEFFIQVKDPITGKYIGDSKHNIEHAKFLKILKKIESKDIKPPKNLTPLKVGKPDKSAVRYEPCKLETIALDKVILFDKGISNKGAIYPQETITKTIIFDFDSSVINAEGNSKLNNALQFLLEHEYSSITVAGYACVIGKENYNQGLSQRRSDAVKKLFVDGGLNAKRIISKGHGEIQIQAGNITVLANDDKKGKDNIKYKDEFSYKEARRVDVSFTFNGHAQTIRYEVIAPSHDKNVTIDITEYQNKACFREKNKHEKKIRVTSPEYSEKKGKEKKGDTITFPIRSSLETWNVAPMQYIWPKYNLLEGATGKALDSATIYNVHAHSCRYFSDEKYVPVIIKAYPDIKWDFHFFLNLSNQLSVKWQKQTPAKHKEMQSKAGKIGAEKRWKQTEIDFGVILEANWDKVGSDKYNGHFDGTLKYEKKIKQFYSVFSSLKEFSKGVTDKVGGKVRKNDFTKNLPITLEILPPNFCLGAIWQLERAMLDKKEIATIGESVEFYLQAHPFIGVEFTIDLLDMLVQAGVGVVSGGTANIAASKILREVRAWLEDDGHPVNLKMYIDLKLTGEISGDSTLKFNTCSDTGEATAKLATKIGFELDAGIEIKAKFVVIIAEAYAEGKMKATGKASATFGHGLEYDQKSSTDKTLYYLPELKFNGLIATVVVKASVGLTIKKGVFKGDRKVDLVDFDKEYNIIPEFDVIKNLEKYAGIDAKIPLIKKN
ncbi:OmpA family protein [Flavobacterium hydatis]|jgi:outer membrane protein OmpA-like peptidoglycan-associated protein|uniref:OmpA-like domain-containing protein n=1 Tax=Flavobacterium hydatis TaxID=991 RepID=A0ABX4CH45_FLAHY|nr:OmpA family protein [Flavobacterium hydatis]OXA94194.1 hypothetical protein B0A62_11080 [Flavobacterium hydatis]